jgi:hypothetical protein
MATIFKSLAPSDYTVTPFPAYYEYTYNYTSGSTNNSPDVQLLYGSKYPFSLSNRDINPQYELYDSIVQIFYSSSAQSTYGIQQSSYVPNGTVYVVSVTQDLYGNTIVPGTFKLTVNSTSSIDDSKGNIIVSSSGVAENVGFVFYDKGIAVIKPRSDTVTSITNAGLYVGDGGTVQIQFTSTLMVYEHAIRLKIEPSEFLISANNPSTQTVISQSKRAVDLMYEKNQLLPYITTLGLYNENNELLAVAKVSNPIQRTVDMPQTFIIKFDT